MEIKCMLHTERIGAALHELAEEQLFCRRKRFYVAKFCHEIFDSWSIGFRNHYVSITARPKRGIGVNSISKRSSFHHDGLNTGGMQATEHSPQLLPAKQFSRDFGCIWGSKL